MSEQQETPKTPVAGETVTPEVGNDAKPTTPESGKVEDSTSQLAELKKQLDKQTMRANQLENQRNEEETARLKETENYKALAEKLEAEKAERQAEDTAKAERQAAIDFREKVIADYPDAVQKAAKRLIEKNPSNLLWKDAQDWEDAGEQLKEQLDALKEGLGISDDDEDEDEGPKKAPRVNANNPNPGLNGIDPDSLSFDELKKVLPRSKRDW